MGKVKRDATSLGATAPVMSPELIVQIEEGTPAQEISYQEAFLERQRESVGDRKDTPFMLRDWKCLLLILAD